MSTGTICGTVWATLDRDNGVSTAGSNECSPNCCGKKTDAFEHSHCQFAACEFRFLLDTFFGPTTCWFGLDVVYGIYLFSLRLRIHMYFWSIVMFEDLYI